MLLLPSLPYNAKAASNPISATIFVVVNAILEVFFLCLVGWILAKKGIVDDKAKKTLNKINVSLFTPALLFSKVAFSLSPDKLKDLAIIPVGFVLVTAFSALVAWLFGHALRLHKGQRNFAIACAMFQNSNSLPIALMQSLIGEKMPLEWGDDDSKDQMLGRALSYLVLYSTLGIIVRWSIGVRLLTSAETELAPNLADSCDSTLFPDDHDDYATGDRTPLIGPGEPRKHRAVRPESSVVSLNTASPASGDRSRTASRNGSPVDPDATLVLPPAATPNGTHHAKQPRPQKRNGHHPVFQSFPNTPNVSHRGSMYGESEEGDDLDDDEDADDDPEWGVRHGIGRRDDDDDDVIFLGIWAVRWRRFKRAFTTTSAPLRRIAKRVGAFMTVPLWAALLSIFVACIPPIQYVLSEAEPLRAAIKNAGNCSVPVTLITLGAYFYRPAPPSSSSRPLLARLNPFSTDPTRFPPDPSTKGETRTVLVAVISRMILVPLVMLPLFGWYATKTVNIADDPVFVVVACLLIGSPTAITLAQITSSASGDVFEKLISRTLFVSYAFLTAPATIALVSAALLIDKVQ